MKKDFLKSERPSADDIPKPVVIAHTGPGY